jgi:ABC-type tungstate transport system permease subunit
MKLCWNMVVYNKDKLSFIYQFVIVNYNSGKNIQYSVAEQFMVVTQLKQLWILSDIYTTGMSTYAVASEFHH